VEILRGKLLEVQAAIDGNPFSLDLRDKEAKIVNEFQEACLMRNVF
jgi:hypothetical protein